MVDSGFEPQSEVEMYESRTKEIAEKSGVNKVNVDMTMRLQVHNRHENQSDFKLQKSSTTESKKTGYHTKGFQSVNQTKTTKIVGHG